MHGQNFKIILYSSSLVPQITKNYNDIDEALRLGFNWSMGPFEMLGPIGLKKFLFKTRHTKLNPFLKNLKNKSANGFYEEDKNILTLKHSKKIKKSVTK